MPKVEGGVQCSSGLAPSLAVVARKLFCRLEGAHFPRFRRKYPRPAEPNGCLEKWNSRARP